VSRLSCETSGRAECRVEPHAEWIGRSLEIVIHSTPLRAAHFTEAAVTRSRIRDQQTDGIATIVVVVEARLPNEQSCVGNSQNETGRPRRGNESLAYALASRIEEDAITHEKHLSQGGRYGCKVPTQAARCEVEGRGSRSSRNRIVEEYADERTLGSPVPADATQAGNIAAGRTISVGPVDWTVEAVEKTYATNGRRNDFDDGS